MTDFDSLTRAVSGKYNDKINKFCSPLFDHFGLGQFFYYKIKNDGGFALLDSCLAWSEYYDYEKFYLIDPYFRHPKFFQDGVVLLKDVQNMELKKILSSRNQKFDLSVILMHIQRTPDGFEAFGFSSFSSNESQISFLLSDLALLRLFAKKFREENQVLFSRLEQNQIDLVKLVGPAFYENNLVAGSNPNPKEIFFEKLGIKIHNQLTPKEIHVLKWLLKGYTAGKIAQSIDLSKRTVEHHIERIKEKLGCESKSELIQKTKELEYLGCLNYAGNKCRLTEI